jgi:ATP-binding cassette, subfamily A (ABC1), member 3
MRFSIPAHSMSPSAPDSTIGRPEISVNDNIDEISPVPTSEFNVLASPRGGNISTLFKMLEENKHKLGLEYYSISQTTLDQVFLKIVGDHQVEEENYRTEQKKGFWAWLLRL